MSTDTYTLTGAHHIFCVCLPLLWEWRGEMKDIRGEMLQERERAREKVSSILGLLKVNTWLLNTATLYLVHHPSHHLRSHRLWKVWWKTQSIIPVITLHFLPHPHLPKEKNRQKIIFFKSKHLRNFNGTTYSLPVLKLKTRHRLL